MYRIQYINTSLKCDPLSIGLSQFLNALRNLKHENVELSLANCTALAPVIGYDKAAKIAKVALETNRTVREVARELSGLDAQALERLLDPEGQAG